MGRIPSNGRKKAKAIGFISELFPFHTLQRRPNPFAVDEGNEVDRKAELMRALPRASFCGPFGEQIELPDGTAVRLEDFKVGLEQAGLILPGQRLRQTFNDRTKFRVERLNTALDGMYAVHDDTPSEHGPELMRSNGIRRKGEGNALPHSAVVTGARKRPVRLKKLP